MKMKITRTFIYTILIGIFLSGNSYGENTPVPIPIDLDAYGVIRSERDCPTNCSTQYDATTMGAECCDQLIDLDIGFTCEILETQYFWNCSGCACSDWDL